MDHTDTAMPSRVAPYTFVSASTEATVALGRVLGGLVADGDLVILTGDLGAGKTQLTKGIAAGMGVTGDVTSPTFTIEMVYEGAALALHHFDLYRLDDASQLEDTGIFDVLGDDGVCVVEWGEQFADELGDDRLEVTITRADDVAACGEPSRTVILAGTGPRSIALSDAVNAHVTL